MEDVFVCRACCSAGAEFATHLYARRVLCDMCWQDACEYIVQNCDFSQTNARSADTIYLCGTCSDVLRTSTTRLPPKVTVRLSPTFTATIDNPKYVLHDPHAAQRIRELGVPVPGQPRRIAGFRPLPARLSPVPPDSPTSTQPDEMGSEASCETGASDDDLCDGTCVRVTLSDEESMGLRRMCMDEWLY